MYEFKIWIENRNFLYIQCAISREHALEIIKRKFPKATLIENYERKQNRKNKNRSYL